MFNKLLNRVDSAIEQAIPYFSPDPTTPSSTATASFSNHTAHNQPGMFESLKNIVKRWVPDISFPDITEHAKFSMGPVELEPEHAKQIAHYHQYQILDAMASDPTHPDHQKAQKMLQKLDKPDTYGTGEAPPTNEEALQLYSDLDLPEWIEDDAYDRVFHQDNAEAIHAEELELPAYHPENTNIDTASQTAVNLLFLTAVVGGGAAGIGYALADKDNDGLQNYQEWFGETDYDNPDTDLDDLPDGIEIRLNTDPLNPDTDNDGLEDGREAELGTDPTNRDTDNDYLTDSKELQRGTDPLNPDTDNDGLKDGSELPSNTNPLNPDTDNDGLKDGEEVKHTWLYPDDPDLDNDGLLDGDELRIETNPLNPDTDGDGLKDGAEVEHGSDPFHYDTHDDDIIDRNAVKYGLDPGTAHPPSLSDALSGLAMEDPILAYKLVNATATDEGVLTDQGRAVLEKAHTLDNDGKPSILNDNFLTLIHQAIQDGEITSEDQKAIETLTSLPDRPLDRAVQHYPDEEGWDKDGDGLLTVLEEQKYRTDPETPDNPEITQIQDTFLEDGQLSGGELRHISTIYRLAEENDQSPQELAHQLNILYHGEQVPGDFDYGEPEPDAHVFIEIDLTEGASKLSSGEEKRLKHVFATSPIGNIQLHLNYDDKVPATDTLSFSDLRSYKSEYFDSGESPAGKDTIYALITEADIQMPSTNVEAQGIADEDYDALAIENDPDGSMFLHELGHALGLSPENYHGIDSHQLAFSEYTSAMNYGSPRGLYVFADGEPFSDWQVIAHDDNLLYEDPE